MITAFGGSLASTNDDHTAFIVKKVITSCPFIVEFLPFQNKVDIWDLEYAANRYVEMQQIQANMMTHRRCFTFITTLSVGESGVVQQDERIIGFTGDYHNSPRGVRLDINRGVRLDIEEVYEEEGDDDEPVESNLHVYVYATHTYTVTERKRFSFDLGNRGNLTPDEIKELINEAINDGDYGERTVDTDYDNHRTEFADVDYASDNGYIMPPNSYFREVISDIA